MTRTANARIRAMDMPVVDRVFGMEGGYVLDFSNRTFAEFFQEELRVDIDDVRLRAAFSRIVERFGGTPLAPEVSSAAPDQSQIAPTTASSLAKRLLEVSELPAHRRGYGRRGDASCLQR